MNLNVLLGSCSLDKKKKAQMRNFLCEETTNEVFFLRPYFVTIFSVLHT